MKDLTGCSWYGRVWPDGAVLCVSVEQREQLGCLNRRIPPEKSGLFSSTNNFLHFYCHFVLRRFVSDKFFPHWSVM